MTPQRNHRCPRSKKWLHMTLPRLSPEPCIENWVGQSIRRQQEVLQWCLQEGVSSQWPRLIELSFRPEPLPENLLIHRSRRKAHRHLLTHRNRRKAHWQAYMLGNMGRGGGLLAAATLHGAIFGLACDSGRRTLTSSSPGRSGVGVEGCRPPPHRTEPFPDSPTTVGGAHRQAITPGSRGFRGRHHIVRSHSWTPPRW